MKTNNKNWKHDCDFYSDITSVSGPNSYQGGLLSTGATLSSFYLLVELGLLLHIFSAYIWGEQDQLLIERNHQTCSKQTILF